MSILLEKDHQIRLLHPSFPKMIEPGAKGVPLYIDTRNGCFCFLKDDLARVFPKGCDDWGKKEERLVQLLIKHSAWVAAALKRCRMERDVSLKSLPECIGSH